MTEPVAVARSQGIRALMGAAIAIVGVVAAANPESAVLRALHQSMPQIADAVPALITASSAIVAAFSQPPKLGHGTMPRGQRGRVARVVASGSGTVP